MAAAKAALQANLIPNGSFAEGPLGGLPENWQASSARPVLAPVFALVRKDDRKVLLAGGNGSQDCVGRLTAPVSVRGGRTYRFWARFAMTADINPQQNLLFGFYSQQPAFNNGIFRFRRLPASGAEGEGRFLIPGRGVVKGEVRIYFRWSARGKVWIEEIGLEECEPVAPRLVRLACVQGEGRYEDWVRILDVSGRAGVDLVLLPESDGKARESERGPMARLMARKAAQYRMYVAGGIYYYDRKADRLYNRALLFDRKGRLAAYYDKNHPYSPEATEIGVTGGHEVPVFKTDFGKVGIMICYDSWFPDVVELLALKGAELILFPNAGYFPGLMPARASDNCVRIMVSSLGTPCGIWDTTGWPVTSREPELHCHPNHPPTFSKVRTRQLGKRRLLMATLDLSRSPSPHNWGGPMLSAPGGRRNRREQKRLLYREIEQEVLRWWEE